MSKYDKVSSLSESDFYRLTGVKRPIFNLMLDVLNEAEHFIRKKGGKRPKLCVADKLLLSLEYLREYRTYFHLGSSYGISESQAHKIHIWVEDILIKDELFHLPSRKKLLSSNDEIEVIMIDASESPIERPKKSIDAIIRGRKSAIL